VFYVFKLLERIDEIGCRIKVTVASDTVHKFVSNPFGRNELRDSVKSTMGKELFSSAMAYILDRLT